ncbi:hypothetical protein E2C01_030615 [Portunus trituberculatus]|uniref:Uncharacterized protein n=1 Tax=Portunus trituberculatus TaxID=210409 RepID=A0A5B7ERA4_PORTR|nr:hypothetical protein [Portunus trituberculatus]
MEESATKQKRVLPSTSATIVKHISGMRMAGHNVNVSSFSGTSKDSIDPTPETLIPSSSFQRPLLLDTS